MERLLAHPPSLPLVHVDHSHRAPAPARTGKCLYASNPSRVVAEYVVETSDKTIIPFEYELSELVCGTTQPKASLDVATQAMDKIVSIAAQEARDQNDWVVIWTAKGNSTKDLLMYVSRSNSKLSSFTPDQLKNKVQKHLTEHWSDEDGPKFLTKVDTDAKYDYGEDYEGKDRYGLP